MSKSLGNLAFVHELIERHPPMALREFLLRHHYRQDWEFSEELLSKQAVPKPSEGPADLDTPAALAVLDRAAAIGTKESNELVAEGRAVLGLDP